MNLQITESLQETQQLVADLLICWIMKIVFVVETGESEDLRHFVASKSDLLLTSYIN